MKTYKNIPTYTKTYKHIQKHTLSYNTYSTDKNEKNIETSPVYL